MKFNKGRQKTGGKRQGSRNRRPFVSFEGAREACERLKCNPADFLVYLVRGDKEALGLSSRQKLDIKERRHAAEFLHSRLEPNLKAIAITNTNGETPVIIVPEKSVGASWAERAQTIREEQQRVLQERLGKATT